MSPIDPARIQTLNEASRRAEGDYILYWMEQSRRADDNPALEHAIARANDAAAPVLVVYGLTADVPSVNRRHLTFMLEGLRETKAALADRGIRLVVQPGPPDDVALSWAEEAIEVVTDRGYLRHQTRWRRRVAKAASCRVTQVEGDVVVPVETASDKAEYAARTLRPKIHEHLDRFLTRPDRVALDRPSLGMDGPTGVSLDDIQGLTDRLDVDDGVPPVSSLYRGGASEARAVLEGFRSAHLEGYDDNRNQVQSQAVSHMSKYLHFGQISPVALALHIQDTPAPDDDVDAYLEELVVRRELAVNHVHFRPDTYDRYECLPDWARDTLDQHADDERQHTYSEADLVQGQTHDPYWNAAMKEMRATGYMHNYMRMYWGKKILEWSPDPHTAFERTLRLNNRYFLDGRDPNSFANVAWIFGLHDRGWKERPVYGKVRYMSRGGLERKADPEAYIEKVDRQATQA
ncbi:MAG: deoxyribodipyrimidine photo-lyase [Salinibacter sp.]